MPVDGFKFVENISDFTEDFIKWFHHYSSDIGYFLKADIIYPELGMSLDLSFLPEKKENQGMWETTLKFKW